MALLNKPTIISNGGIISPFSATVESIIKFSVIGGNQVVKNEIEIYNNTTEALVYTHTQDNFLYTHTIIANVLTNSSTFYYKVRLRTYDINNNVSDWSGWVLFKCLSPIITSFTNIVNGKIGNQTETFTLSYSQPQSSVLQSYRFYLYNSSKELLETSSEIFYAQDNSLSFTFTGFENDKSYYIQGKVISVDQLEGDTGLIEFKAEFIQPMIQNVIEAVNVPTEGKIKVTAKIIQILGQVGSGTISYIDNDWIDLRNGSIHFNEENGFKLTDDFTFKIWLKNIPMDESYFVEFMDTNCTIKLNYYNDRIHAWKTMNGVVSHYASNTVSITSSDTVFIFMQSINNRIELKLEKI